MIDNVGNNVNNATDINVNKDSDSKKILTMIILIATLMICTTGATYAYFAISSTNNVATGTAATVGLNLNVTRVTPTTTKWNSSTQVMVPQLDSALSTAMNSTNSCVDGNGNVVCQVYKITIENTSTAAVSLRGAVYFTLGSGATYTNLYWKRVTNANTLGSNKTFKYSTSESTNSSTADAANATLLGVINLTEADGTTGSGADYSEYYVMVWIRETNADQSSTDKGTWTMNVSFKDSGNGKGVTSTITS